MYMCVCVCVQKYRFGNIKLKAWESQYTTHGAQCIHSKWYVQCTRSTHACTSTDTRSHVEAQTNMKGIARTKCWWRRRWIYRYNVENWKPLTHWRNLEFEKQKKVEREKKTRQQRHTEPAEGEQCKEEELDEEKIKKYEKNRRTNERTGEIITTN